MNKSAFTLIELLAVIVVLGVILTIAVPSVSKITLNSKEDAAYIEVSNAVKNIKLNNIDKEQEVFLVKKDLGNLSSLIVFSYNDSNEKKYAVIAKMNNDKKTIIDVDDFSNVTKENRNDVNNEKGTTLFDEYYDNDEFNNNYSNFEY